MNTFKKTNIFKITLICTNLLKIWYSENIHQHICMATETEYCLCKVTGWAIFIISFTSKLSPFIFVKSASRCHMPIQCETFVPRFYLSLSSILNVWDSQSQPKIRSIGLTDHKELQWTVKQGNESISGKKRLDGLRNSKASYCSELHCVISSNQMRILRRKIIVT